MGVFFPSIFGFIFDARFRERKLKAQAKQFGMSDTWRDDKEPEKPIVNDYRPAEKREAEYRAEKRESYDPEKPTGDRHPYDDDDDYYKKLSRKEDRSHSRRHEDRGSERAARRDPPPVESEYSLKDEYKSKEEYKPRSGSERASRSHTRDDPPPARQSREKKYDDLPSPPPRKQPRDASPDILEVKEITKPHKSGRDERKERRSRSPRDRSSRRNRSPEHRSSRRRASPSPPRKRGGFKPAMREESPKHYLSRDAPFAQKKSDPNDFFNDELKKAITEGRIKMTERELLVDGPNYSHTTNGKEEMYQKCRIFVGHLPVDFLSKDDIFHIFEKYGKILAISLHKGYAFLQFKSPEMAELAATSENGRRVKGACLEVNLATISKDEARKLPREGATLPAIHRLTPQCRLFLESEHDRMYACQIERKLRALGITVDSCIWKETARRTKHDALDGHLNEMAVDPDSICAIQIGKDDIKRKTATVHIFKNDLEGLLDWNASVEHYICHGC